MSTRMSTRRFVLAPLALSACIALVACSQPAETGVSSSETNTSEARSVAAEVTSPQARLVATYDGGITVLDAETLEEITDIPLEGFNRLNPLGDQRTVAVSTPEGFRVLDAGAWTQPHGDHSHSYTTDPQLTEQVFAGDKPGHVVNNAGRTLLFSDGDGIIQELDNEALTAGSQDAELELPDAADETFELTPHHGVAVALGDGGMVHTEGTEDERSTIVAVDADGEETARLIPALGCMEKPSWATVRSLSDVKMVSSSTRTVNSPRRPRPMTMAAWATRLVRSTPLLYWPITKLIRMWN